MVQIQLPLGNTTTPSQHLSKGLLLQALKDLLASQNNFTGYVGVTSQDTIFLLFIFNSRLYSAGRISSRQSGQLTIRGFVQAVSVLDQSATFSIHATDPVLLKCLLVLVQGFPTAKAPVSMIDLEAVLAQITRQESDALVILETDSIYNFFFFKSGKPGMAYLGDQDFKAAEGLPVDEQMLVYGFQGSDRSIDAIIYHSLLTKEATDSTNFDMKKIREILLDGEAKEHQFEIGKTDRDEENLVLAVMEGPHKGENFSGRIPCVIGSKETDIVLNDPLVSKRHAAVHVINGRLMLVDLNSINGTFVNGNRTKQHSLYEGDIIWLGNSKLKVLKITPP